MFGRRAVIITQCLGGGASSTIKDIKNSLSWWGISYIRTCKFKLMGDIVWDRLPEYTDFKYWKEQGWIDGVRPWK